MRRTIVIGALILLSGCGESGNDPSRGRNIDGSWQIAFTDMEINGVETCTLGPLAVVFDQTSTTVQGTHEATQLDCSVSGIVVQTAGLVTSGTFVSNTITIRMDETAKTRRFVGTFAGDTAMSGTVEWTTEDGVQLVNGLWSAVKD